MIGNYEALGVPELWRWNGRSLEINVLQDGKYVESNTSRIFPNLLIAEVIPEYLARTNFGRNATMKAFRYWVRERL